MIPIYKTVKPDKNKEKTPLDLLLEKYLYYTIMFLLTSSNNNICERPHHSPYLNLINNFSRELRIGLMARSFPTLIVLELIAKDKLNYRLFDCYNPTIDDFQTIGKGINNF